MAANAGAQVVDAQVDGAQLGKAVQALLGRLAHVLGANGGHHGQATHGIQPGTDHPAVDAVVGIVAHQLRPHVDARHHLLRGNAGDLEPQQLVEDDLLFKDGGEPGEELGFEHDGGSGSRRSGHKHP